MKKECPNGHPFAVRQDPEGTGMRAECDTCGWRATFAVSREDADWQENGDHQERAAQLERAQADEQRRLAPAAAPGRETQGSGNAPARRRAD